MTYLSTAAARLRTAAIAAVALAGLTPSSAAANSEIVVEYQRLYGGSIAASCGDCHSAGLGFKSATNTFFSYGNALADQIPNNTTSARNAATIRSAMRAIEPTYAPQLTTGPSIQLAGDAGSLTANFSRGLTDRGAAATLTSVPSTLPSGFSGNHSSGATSINIGISLSLVARGNARRSNTPFQLSFRPVNSAFYRNTLEIANAESSVLSVTFANLPPVASNDSFTTPGDQQLSGNVFTQGVADTDPDSTTFIVDTASVDRTGLVGTLSINANGSFTYDPPTPPSNDNVVTSFKYTLVDGENASSNEATVTITILGVAAQNAPPTAVDDTFDIDEDTVLTDNVITPSTGANDDDGGDGPAALSVTVAQGPAFGQLQLQSNGAFTYTPNLNATGDQNNQDSFTYTLSDGADTDQGAVTINIEPINDPPMVAAIEFDPVNDDADRQTLDLLDPRFVIDPDDTNLIVSDLQLVVTPDPATAPNTLGFTQNGGMVTINPAELALLDNGEKATAVFTYTITDGKSAPIPNTATIVINGVDNGVGERIAGQYADTLASRFNDHFATSAVRNDSCHACHQVGQVGADIDDVNDCTANLLTPYGLELCLARDPGEPPLSDLVRRLSLSESNFSPILDDTPPLTIGNTAEVGDPVGDPVASTQRTGRTFDGKVATIFGYSLTRNGRLSQLGPNGSFRIGNDGQIRVAGPLTPGRFFLDVRPINDAGQKDNDGDIVPNQPGFFPQRQDLLRFVQIDVVLEQPVAVGESVNLEAEVPTVIDVLANDSGAGISQVQITTPPAVGQAIVNSDLTVTYTSNANVSGPDSFQYVAVNGAGASDPATVSLTVVPVGGGIARNDSAATTLNTPITVDVLANDRGENLVVSIVTPPGNGAAEVTEGGILYTPDTGFSGVDTVEYRASNAIGGSNAVLTITVSQVDGDVLAAATNDPELKKVAQALGDSCVAIGPDGEGDAADLYDVCIGLASDAADGADIDAALAAIRNEEALVAESVLLTVGRAAGDRLMRRLAGVSTRGVDFSALSMTMGGVQAPIGVLAAAASAAAGIPTDSPWGVHVSGDIILGDGDSDDLSSSFDIVSVGVTAGLDYQVHETLLTGVAFSFATSETDIGGGGDLDMQSFELSVYGRYDVWQFPGLSVSGVLTGGLDDYDQERVISFTGANGDVDRVAEADYNGEHINLIGEVEYIQPFSLGEHEGASTGNVGGFVGADLLIGWIDGYTEKGAQGLNLKVDGRSFESLILTAGVQADATFRTEWGSVQPYGRLSGNVEVLDDQRSITSSFAAAGAASESFIVSEDGSDSVFAGVDLGVRMSVGQGTLDLGYGGVFGRDVSTEHRFSAGYQTPLFGNDMMGFSLAGAPLEGTSNLDMRLDYQLRF